MVDNINMLKTNLNDSEKENIIKLAGLQKLHYKNQVSENDPIYYYETGTELNLKGGMYIKIDIQNRLTVRGSLHKYASFLETGYATNYGRFTMEQARITFFRFLINKGIELDNLKIKTFEIGSNLVSSIHVIRFLTCMIAIGTEKYKKELMTDPNYRLKSCKTTEKSSNIRIVYKAYDKVFEMLEKRHKATPSEKNILRIETTFRKVNILAKEFFTEINLKAVQDDFFRRWDLLVFEPTIVAPKGTHQSKINLVTEIYKTTAKITLNKYQQLFKDGKITAKMYRKTREFINDWHVQKKVYKLGQSEIMPFWATAYNTEKEELNKIYL
ncbi:hypothetical protein [Tenacibaculum finnmarkense]|uniref:hypothetical protein n=1 Tax=Tenacibaculum finnmarkense TaxID=2781243 RepID=UPI001EFBDAA1|nr:hypothetical protein [Tenacibaculum finnmarkense]MCG8206160.1 hypothetical protein [Tenacibaculum finnmarkense genomovar finnmarkense]MCG8721145.1 hypothetical protein [Tenacibaculum finnmarkense]MCM8907494.1 hypothetical protein [Tenacibaculum finnmarkense genomovar finnmarkense]